MWNKYKLLMADLNFGKKRFLEFQLITKAVLTLLIWPVINLILNSLLRMKGMEYVTNGMITKFMLSPQGIMAFLSMSTILIFVVLIELGGLILMSYQVINREPASRYLPTLRHCIAKLPRFFGFEGLILVLGVGLVLPWLEIGGTTSLVSSLQIPGFVQDVIDSSALYTFIEAVVMLAVLFLAIRFIFVLHFMMLENVKSKEAFKSSARLIKAHYKSFFKEAIGVSLINLLVQMLFMILIVIVFLGILSVPDIPAEIFDYVLYTLVFLGIGIWLAVSFMMTPLGTLHLTRFFLENRESERPLINVKLTTVPDNRFIDKLIFKRRNIILLIAASIAGSAFFSFAVLTEFDSQKKDVKITAHRGNVLYAPENTVAGIETAYRNGAHYAEIDVQQTLDGELVLLHDSSLKRTTGDKRNVWEVSLSEIKELDAGSHFSEAFEGEPIPTLSEAIVASDGKIQLNIEIKINGHEKDIVSMVVEEIEAHGIVDTCVVTSLDYDVLQEVEALNEDIKTGYIMFVALGDLSKLNVDFYSVEELNVNDKFVTQAHLLGREVHVWTINEADDMTELINLGVDSIITDDELLLKERLNATDKASDILGVIDSLL